MKDSLTDQDRLNLVNYRFDRAYSTLEEAEYMRKGNFFNASVNRLYYACYYAASGLLISKGIEANTHSGVKTMLSMHFVRTGLLPLEYGATFSNLFEKRHSSDYDDFMFCDAAMVDYLLPRAKDFIDRLKLLSENCDLR
ncbi:MAG: HEPN domain-containing protein [Muribaculaceae bacterium]